MRSDASVQVLADRGYCVPQGGNLAQATVVVCTRNRHRELERCLAALARQTHGAFNVLVVDNASAVPVAGICARWRVDCIREPRAGLCVARNAGVRHASGEIVAFIDDDAVPESAWLATLLRGFADPSVAAVSGRILYMKASVDDRGGMSTEEAPGANSPRLLRTIDRGTPNWFARACLGGVGDGSNMAFRRKALLESPGFDDRLGRGRLLDGGDEHVVFMSLVALGHRIAHVPEAVIRHPYPATPDLVCAKRIHERRTSIAYLMFLWGEFPAHRASLVRHLAGAVARRLPTGAAAPVTAGEGLTYGQAFRSALAGISLYRAARREWSTIRAPDYRVLAVARTAA